MGNIILLNHLFTVITYDMLKKPSPINKSGAENHGDQAMFHVQLGSTRFGHVPEGHVWLGSDFQTGYCTS